NPTPPLFPARLLRLGTLRDLPTRQAMSNRPLVPSQAIFCVRKKRLPAHRFLELPVRPLAETFLGSSAVLHRSTWLRSQQQYFRPVDIAEGRIRSCYSFAHSGRLIEVSEPS